MSTFRIRLEPLGESLEVRAGAPLRDSLFAHGVEFPCGGRGRCRKCRVRLLEGGMTADEETRGILTREELAEGWRLACRAIVEGDIALEIGQWETPILADDSTFCFTPRPGAGAVLDIGTTTLVAQALDLETGRVLGVQSALNPQAARGSDVMSRVEAALEPDGLGELSRLIREAAGELLQRVAVRGLSEVVLVGNTVMHHLFCGIDPEPLSHYPFEPRNGGLATYRAQELGWPLPGDPVVQFLPCIGGFVGSDILAGILATGIHEAERLTGLLDLGTNGEVVFGSRRGILCASTAAGPAFEGGRISTGMRAATGAISAASANGGSVRFEVLGGGAPRGICGSGLVDVVAAGLETGRIATNGRFTDGSKQWRLDGPVALLQRDVSELQLAKGAVAAGARVLLRQLGGDEPEAVFLAGAFGNYVNKKSARRIGLLEFPTDRVISSGNTALLGAKLALFHATPEEREFSGLRRLITHVSLAADAEFEDIFVESMRFPDD